MRNHGGATPGLVSGTSTHLCEPPLDEETWTPVAMTVDTDAVLFLVHDGVVVEVISDRFDADAAVTDTITPPIREGLLDPVTALLRTVNMCLNPAYWL